MKLKLKRNQGLYQYLLSIASDELENMIDNEFKEIFDRISVKPKSVLQNTYYEAYNRNIADIPRGYLSKSKIRENFVRFKNNFVEHPMMASYQAENIDGVLRIRELKVIINDDKFKTIIIDCMDVGLDVLIEWIKISIRHEVGHLIEYVSFDGMSIDEYLEMRDRRNKAREDHYQKWENVTNHTSESEDSCMLEYYQLEGEAAANVNACISTDELIALDNKMALYGKDYEVEIEINTKYTLFDDDGNVLKQ